ELDRENPQWRNSGPASPASKQVPVDEKLTAEEVFAVNEKEAHLPLRGGFIIRGGGGPCKDCIDDKKLSQTEKLRLSGLIRIHQMAALTLYNNRCGHPPFDDKAAAAGAATIESQFRKLPREVQQRALDHEVKLIESRSEFYDQGVLIVPGGWQWFC